MTDKDSQLDEIERISTEMKPYVSLQSLWEVLDASMFRGGGLYYEMRRENVFLIRQLEALGKILEQVRREIEHGPPHTR